MNHKHNLDFDELIDWVNHNFTRFNKNKGEALERNDLMHLYRLGTVRRSAGKSLGLPLDNKLNVSQQLQ